MLNAMSSNTFELKIYFYLCGVFRLSFLGNATINQIQKKGGHNMQAIRLRWEKWTL